MRKALRSHSEPVLPHLFEQNTDTLSLFQHAAAFGLVDYLIQSDGERFNQLLVQLHQKKETRQALKELYGSGVLALEERWRSWIQETYPKR